MEADKWYLSKRYWAAAILFVTTFLVNFGIDVDAETQGKLAEYFATLGSSIAAVVGIVLAVWSKKNEKKKISAGVIGEKPVK